MRRASSDRGTADHHCWLKDWVASTPLTRKQLIRPAQHHPRWTRSTSTLELVSAGGLPQLRGQERRDCREDWGNGLVQARSLQLGVDQRRILPPATTLSSAGPAAFGQATPPADISMAPMSVSPGAAAGQLDGARCAMTAACLPDDRTTSCRCRGCSEDAVDVPSLVPRSRVKGEPSPRSWPIRAGAESPGMESITSVFEAASRPAPPGGATSNQPRGGYNINPKAEAPAPDQSDAVPDQAGMDTGTPGRDRPRSRR